MTAIWYYIVNKSSESSPASEAEGIWSSLNNIINHETLFLVLLIIAILFVILCNVTKLSFDVDLLLNLWYYKENIIL